MVECYEGVSAERISPGRPGLFSEGCPFPFACVMCRVLNLTLFGFYPGSRVQTFGL